MRHSGRTHIQSGPGSSLPTQDAFLRANSGAYEWIIEKIQSMDWRNEAEAVLRRIEEGARFAARFHPGRFADGAIENVAFQIGVDLRDPVADGERFTIPLVSKDSRRRLLHVAYDVLGVGGLTRMLHHWVQHDPTSHHSILLINQSNMPVPQWLSEAVRRSGGDLFVFPSEWSHYQKAQWLRHIAMRETDLVVLHHCAFDMVPTVAFATAQCPPVAILNHADHHFWLGSSVSDLVINLRTAGSKHTMERRFISSNTVLPVPLADPKSRVSRLDARHALGIPTNQVVLLSVGRAEKYRPCGPYDFVATAGKILDRQPCAHLYVVGESPQGIAPYLRCGLHERLHLIGEMEDSSLYRAAADVYLESFPFGSQTALLEAALGGIPAVPAYAPLFPLLVTNDDAIQDLIPNPKDENEYVERVELLIQQTEWRAEFGQVLRKRLLVDHVGEGWLTRLAAIYQETDRLTHGPGPIPISPCSIEGADIGLSLWRVMADGKSCSRRASMEEAKVVLCHAAFVARDVGNYAAARRYAWTAMWQDPLQWMSWRLLSVALIGRAGKPLRRMLNQALLIVKKTLCLTNRTLTPGAGRIHRLTRTPSRLRLNRP